MEHDTDLSSKLALAQDECARLREENEQLKKQLLSAQKAHAKIDSGERSSENDTPAKNQFQPIDNKFVIAAQAAITNTSEPDAKIALFRKLFRGREDVYALRWVGRNGKSGYSPAAPRDDNHGFKTSDYKKRKCFPLTDAVIRDHLLGKHTVGIYPLLR